MMLNGLLWVIARARDVMLTVLSKARAVYMDVRLAFRDVVPMMLIYIYTVRSACRSVAMIGKARAD